VGESFPQKSVNNFIALESHRQLKMNDKNY